MRILAAATALALALGAGLALATPAAAWEDHDGWRHRPHHFGPGFGPGPGFFPPPPPYGHRPPPSFYGDAGYGDDEGEGYRPRCFVREHMEPGPYGWHPVRRRICR